ncbi:type I restriction-modification system subunit M N-terminal domain-containing protein, partial [Escherichia coli]|nr:type I restriction-modification system subunit M N-terminal domain-containing protein [Escherichia coli]
MSPQIEAQNLSELQSRLWNIADTLRGKMNADEFRDYCLGFIFYKYLSE